MMGNDAPEGEERQKTLNLLSRRIDAIELELDRLTRAYDGENSLAPGVIGILRRHNDMFVEHADRIDKVERTIDRVRWTVTGAAGIGSLLGGSIGFALTQLFGG